jgi:TetR/AcrR family transcriptional regulator, transcriptional repressor for nem operon
MRRKISREGILQTGQELFLSRGYNGVSVGDITARVGIPKGSFYNHFHSKHEFLAAVIDRYANESYELVNKHLRAKDIPPLQKLKNYFAEASEYYSADPDRLEGCLMGNICQELGSVDPAIRKQLEANFGALTTYLRIYSTRPSRGMNWRTQWIFRPWSYSSQIAGRVLC